MRERGHDQAAGLRQLFARTRTPVVSVLNAGGDAATSVTVELALALATIGMRTLIIDPTSGEAALALGVKARYELAHVVSGDKTLCQVLLDARDGVSILPAMRGLGRIADDGSWQQRLDAAMRAAGTQAFDAWLVNGAAPQVEGAESLLVVAANRAAVTTAYARIKSLSEQGRGCALRILVRDAASESAAQALYQRIAETARRFLATELQYGGCLLRVAAGTPRPCATAVPPAEHRSSNVRAYVRIAESLVAAPAAAHAA